MRGIVREGPPRRGGPRPAQAHPAKATREKGDGPARHTGARCREEARRGRRPRALRVPERVSPAVSIRAPGLLPGGP